LFTLYDPKLDSQVAMKLAPDRKKFMDVVCGNGDINADIEKFCATFTPILQENHKFLVRSSCSVHVGFFPFN